MMPSSVSPVANHIQTAPKKRVFSSMMLGKSHSPSYVSSDPAMAQSIQDRTHCASDRRSKRRVSFSTKPTVHFIPSKADGCRQIKSEDNEGPALRFLTDVPNPLARTCPTTSSKSACSFKGLPVQKSPNLALPSLMKPPSKLTRSLLSNLDQMEWPPTSLAHLSLPPLNKKTRIEYQVATNPNAAIPQDRTSNAALLMPQSTNSATATATATDATMATLFTTSNATPVWCLDSCTFPLDETKDLDESSIIDPLRFLPSLSASLS